MLWQHCGVEESAWEREDMMRATYPFLFRDEGTWFNRLRFKWLVTCMIECALHMHVSDCNFPEFRDEIPFKVELLIQRRLYLIFVKLWVMVKGTQ